MRVITAPDLDANRRSSSIVVFLAGGISGCSNWQDEVINKLDALSNYHNLSNVAIYNPRREDFDTAKREDTIEQIKWEYCYLKQCDIFSVFFSASESVQPITLYELGTYGHGYGNPCRETIVTVQKGYKREQDVLIQCALDSIPVNHIAGEEAIECHAQSIVNAINKWRKK